MCASSRVTDSRDNVSMSNAAVEHVDSSDEHEKLMGIDREKSDSRRRGMGKRGCIDEWSWPVETPRPTVQIPKSCCQLGRADSNASCKEVSVDGQGESGKLVPTTVELDNPGGSETPSMCLGGTKTQVGEVESHKCRVGKSNGWVNESKGQADASTMSNTCETVAMGDGGGTGARLDAGGARRDGAGPDGHAN